MSKYDKLSVSQGRLATKKHINWEVGEVGD